MNFAHTKDGVKKNFKIFSFFGFFMDNIKDIVKQVVGGLAQGTLQHQSKIQNLWNNILSPEELKHTRLVSFKDGRLVVFVDSSVFLYQLNLKRGQILLRLKNECEEVKNLYLKVGKVQ